MDSSASPQIDRQMVAGGLLDTLPPGVAVLAFDTQLRFVAMHGDALRRAGLGEDAVLGRTVPEVLRASSPAAELLGACRRALVGGDSRLQLSGARAWQIALGPLRDGDGRIVGGLATVQDVTAARQARRLHGARAR